MTQDTQVNDKIDKGDVERARSKKGDRQMVERDEYKKNDSWVCV